MMVALIRSLEAENVIKKLYIIRHGDALPAQAMRADSIRPLSECGEIEVAASAKWLQQRLIEQGAQQIDWLLVSPYVRARQTAAVLSSYVKVAKQQQYDDITPDGNAAQVMDWLLAQLSTQQQDVEHVAVVSHMPLVSYLVAAFDPATQPLLFPTAGIAELSLDVEHWAGHFIQLVSPLEPESLREPNH
jgi:phosphohistidine phosphatase